MQIIKYPHPTLRHKSKPLRRVDGELKRTIGKMLELMYADKGIGLAANQVDLPYRLLVMNLESDPQAKDQRGMDALALARKMGNAPAIELLSTR